MESLLVKSSFIDCDVIYLPAAWSVGYSGGSVFQGGLMKSLACILVLLLSFTISTGAFANTYVKCGRTADFDSGEVQGYELELSSEGADDYSGPVGQKWNLKLESEDSAWLARNRNIVARSYMSDDDTVVEITIKQAITASGPVGHQYKLVGLYDETPKLFKYTMGGFAGSVLIGTFQCLSGND